jgi:hypothetical protein
VETGVVIIIPYFIYVVIVFMYTTWQSYYWLSSQRLFIDHISWETFWTEWCTSVNWWMPMYKCNTCTIVSWHTTKLCDYAYTVC